MKAIIFEYFIKNEKKIPLWIFSLVLLTGLISAFILLSQDIYSLSYYGDANSRIVQTRLLIDSKDPGIHRFGTVWLPLPQLLFLPFTAIDGLYFTGLAGFAVNMVLLAFSAVFIYKSSLQLTEHTGISALVAILFGINPNLQYSSMTTMTETTSLFFIIGTIYYLLLWLKTEKPLEDLSNLLKISLYLAGATLCRYESYLMVPFFFGIIIWIIFLKRSIPNMKKLLIYSSISALGILIWLIWNQAKYGDFLYFSHAEYYSAAWQAKHRDVSKGLASQLGNVLSMYSITTLAIFGVVLPIFSLIGLFKNHHFKVKFGRIIFYLFSLIAVFTTLYSMYNGVAEMTFWWNSRYALLMSPFLFISASLGLKHVLSNIDAKKYLGIALVILLFSMYGIQLSISRYGVVCYADAIGGFTWKQTPKAVQVGETLKKNYTYGEILNLTGSAQSQRIMQTSGIAGKNFTVALNKDGFASEPWSIELFKNFDWIIISKAPDEDSEKIAKSVIKKLSEFTENYNTIYENEYYLLLKKK